MTIKVLHLVTGEEILGDVTKEDAVAYTIKDPVRIVVVQQPASKLDLTKPSGPSVGFAPYQQWSDDKEFAINKTNVISTANPIEQFKAQYQAAFGQIITPNPSKLLVP